MLKYKEKQNHLRSAKKQDSLRGSVELGSIN